MAADLIKTTQDLTALSWSERANTSGTGGTFLKARKTTSRKTMYYKLSCYDSYRGIYGHECVNELVASRLMGLLGVDHVEYRLVHANVLVDGRLHETWLSASESFRMPGERKQPFDLFFDLNRENGESPLELARRFGWGKTIERMMAIDYLIANRDRHGANVEVIFDSNGEYRLAPIFDSGLSFVFSCYGDEARIDAFDPLEDVNANNFIGSRSLEENLKMIEGPLGFP